MLRIIQYRSAASAQSYYSKADYYSEGQELVGHWGGLAAERLGLTGEIQQKDFQALCENKNPETGEQLTPRIKADRTVGSVPSSVPFQCGDCRKSSRGDWI